MSDILASLASTFSADLFKTDTASLEHYCNDRTGLSSALPLAVFLPRSTEHIQQLVLLANSQGFAVVPCGGRTGLSGGACSLGGEVMLSLESMKRILAFDENDGVMHCEAGLITGELQQFVRSRGFDYPVDFAASGSSQIGGNVATNAGGVHVMRYGMTREQVLGLVVVTGEGKVLQLDKGLQKNNAGYDLKQLFIGSEGTLGIISEVQVKCVVKPQTSTLLLGFDDFASLLAFFRVARSAVALQAAEFYSGFCEQQVLENTPLAPVFSRVMPWSLLLEFDRTDTAPESLSSLLENSPCLDSCMAGNDRQAEKLWAIREAISDALAKRLLIKNDIAVRTGHLENFLIESGSLLEGMEGGCKLAAFGHLGDGNIHFNVLAEADFLQQADKAQAARDSINHGLISLLQKYRGSVSAEHGIGLLKKQHLSATLSETERHYMQQLKKVFDPNGVLNPGKVLE